MTLRSVGSVLLPGMTGIREVALWRGDMDISSMGIMAKIIIAALVAFFFYLVIDFCMRTKL